MTSNQSQDISKQQQKPFSGDNGEASCHFFLTSILQKKSTL
jgi:hypothetical protein